MYLRCTPWYGAHLRCEAITTIKQAPFISEGYFCIMKTKAVDIQFNTVNHSHHTIIKIFRMVNFQKEFPLINEVVHNSSWVYAAVCCILGYSMGEKLGKGC